MSSPPAVPSQTPAKRASVDQAVAVAVGNSPALGTVPAANPVDAPETTPLAVAPKRRKSVGVAVATLTSDEPVDEPVEVPPSASTMRPRESAVAPSASSDAASGHNDVPQLGEASRRAGKARAVDTDSAPDIVQYRLKVAQQPTIGCAFGDALLSRLAIAPPLILELDAVDSNGKEVDISGEAPFLVCQCALTLENGASADLFSPSPFRSSASSTQPSPTPPTSKGGKVQPPSGSGTPSSGSLELIGGSGSRGGALSPARGVAGKRRGRRRSGLNLSPATPPPASPLREMAPPARMLYGTLAANPIPYNSPEGPEKMYLLFPEISIRATGRFRLRCFLIRLPMPGGAPPSPGALEEVVTEAFEVVAPSDYVAPYLTDLTRHIARQGAGLLLPPGQAAD